MEQLVNIYDKYVIKCNVDADYAELAVLSDVHQGLNDRKLLQESVRKLLKLPNCRVILGGDSTNTTTKHSKGNVLEEWAVGENQVYSLVEDIRPLYESGQLIGVMSGNHGKRAYNDAFIRPEMMVATLLGNPKLYVGEIAIVYFNVRKNCYVHHVLHKHRKAKNYYDYFNADVTWFEHFHEMKSEPKIVVEHNKYAKKPTVKTVWELHQGSFQTYPEYIRESGIRPNLNGFWIANMTGDHHKRKVNPFMNDVYFDLKGI